MEITSNNVFEIVLILWGLYDILMGMAGFFTGKIYINAKALTQKYTEESLSNYAKPYGVFNALMGLAVIVLGLVNIGLLKNVSSAAMWVIFGVLMAAAIVILLLNQKKLQKKKEESI